MKFKHYIPITIITLCAPLWFASLSSGKVIFSDNFDLEAPDEGSPNNFFTFGMSMTSIVVNPRQVASRPYAAILTLDFIPGTWGGGMIVEKFEPTNFDGAIFSAKVCASEDLSKKTAVFSFRAEDADGTIMRANLENMSTLSREFTEIALPINKLTQVDEWGLDMVFDTSKIVSFGFCVYNQGDHDGVVHFYIDDVTVTIPDTVVTSSDITALSNR